MERQTSDSEATNEQSRSDKRAIA